MGDGFFQICIDGESVDLVNCSWVIDRVDVLR